VNMPPITMVREGRPVRPADLALELCRCARVLLEETGRVPPALWDAIDRAIELALPPESAFARLPAGWFW